MIYQNKHLHLGTRPRKQINDLHFLDQLCQLQTNTTQHKFLLFFENTDIILVNPKKKIATPVNSGVLLHSCFIQCVLYKQADATVIDLLFRRTLIFLISRKNHINGGYTHEKTSYLPDVVNEHCVKSVHIRSFFGSVFSCIRTEYRKIRTRKNSVFGHFSRSANTDEKRWVMVS